MPRWIDTLQKVQRGEAPPPPIAQLIGFELKMVEPGRVRVELEASARHANPMGTLHGGVICDVADAAMGMAHASTLEDDETFTTIELKVSFLRPVWTGKIVADAHIAHRGRTISLVDCDVTNADGKLVARVSSTVMTLRGESAKGR